MGKYQTLIVKAPNNINCQTAKCGIFNQISHLAVLKCKNHLFLLNSLYITYPAQINKAIGNNLYASQDKTLNKITNKITTNNNVTNFFIKL